MEREMLAFSSKHREPDWSLPDQGSPASLGLLVRTQVRETYEYLISSCVVDGRDQDLALSLHTEGNWRRVFIGCRD